MKLIRLTDDRYILDAGPDARAADVEHIQNYWKTWWETEQTAPTAVVIAGSEIPLEYEDRRESDIEARLKRLEAHVHIVHGIDMTTTPIRNTKEPPMGGIEQYQAEDR